MLMRAYPLLVVMMLVTSAAADGTTLEGLVRQAESAEKNARDSGDVEAYETCAASYIEVVNAAIVEMPDIVPDMLYNAAVCFEGARSVGAAVTAYTRLVEGYVTNRLAARAMARRARLYMAIAWYDKAAEDLEVYAKKYAAEADAADALENAFRLRAALGDEDKARADAELWIKMFSARKVREAAEVALMLAFRTREHGKREDAVDAYRAWLTRYSGKADRERVAAAYLAIGDMTWESSCKVKTAKGGLCLAPPKKGAEPRCGTPPQVAVARDDAKMKEAVAALKMAVRTADSSGDQWAQLRGDQARLILADARLEAALATEMPVPLVDAAGKTTPASKKQLAEWLATWQQQVTGARRDYEELLRSRNMRVSIVASGRIAFLMQHAADALASAPLPKMKKPKLDEIRVAYCDTLQGYAEQLDKQAEAAVAACLSLAAQASIVEETAQCTAIYDRYHPEAAAGGERVPGARAPMILDVEPAITRSRP